MAVVLEDQRIACGDAFGPSRPTQDLFFQYYLLGLGDMGDVGAVKIIFT